MKLLKNLKSLIKINFNSKAAMKRNKLDILTKESYNTKQSTKENSKQKLEMEIIPEVMAEDDLISYRRF